MVYRPPPPYMYVFIYVDVYVCVHLYLCVLGPARHQIFLAFLSTVLTFC